MCYFQQGSLGRDDAFVYFDNAGTRTTLVDLENCVENILEILRVGLNLEKVEGVLANGEKFVNVFPELFCDHL